MPTPIQKIFAEVPATYEKVNHSLTFGLDILWRRKAVSIAAQSRPGRWLDVCSGTGETAAYLVAAAPPGTRVYVADFSLPMLRELLQKPEAKTITPTIADVKALPFADNSFDLITVSFATRNINTRRADLTRAFSEFLRILSPGGRFVMVETSQPPLAPVRFLRNLYVKLFVQRLGARLSGSPRGYAYLSNTIPRFYAAPALAEILREAGFGNVKYRHLLLGAAAIHEGEKI